MNETWTDVRNDIRATKNPEEVLTLLHKADAYDEDTRRRVLSSGLDRLWDLEYFDFENILLEQCALRSGYEGHTIHVLLKRWLKENPYRRDDVIRRLLAELDKPDTFRVQNVLWTLISVGYRSQTLEDKLLAFVKASSDAQIRHLALWGLTILGYANHTFLEKMIQKIIEEADVIPELIMYCGRQIASPKLLPHFRDYLLHVHYAPDDTRDLVSLLYVLSDTAREHPELASAVWDTIIKFGNTPEGVAHGLLGMLSFWAGIPDNIDDPRVVDFFLHGLEPDNPEEDRASNRISSHYRPYLRLSGFNLPNQLTAMHTSLQRADATTRQKVLELLHQDATVNTRNASVFQTGLSDIKKHCWDTLLCLNLPETKQWIVEALNEDGPFAATKICALAGYLRVREAIPKLQEWIKLEGWDNDPQRHITLGLAAIEALGNIGTREAFQALTESQVSLAKMRPDLSVADTTPRDYGDAFTACVLTMQDVEPLLACLEEEPTAKTRCWVACAFALQQVAFAEPSLVEPHRERVFALLHREDLVEANPLYLHYLLPALGGFEKDKDVETLLRNWACKEDENAHAAVEVLARWGTLRTYPDLLEKLGLVQTETAQWKVTQGLNIFDVFIIGLLFWHHPEEFTTAVCDLIEEGTYREAIQVFQQLSSENTSRVILDALSKRAHRVNKSFQAETDALWTLRRVSPDRFVKEFPYELVCNWHALAREAVVSAHRELHHKKAPDTLVKFMTDGVYGIRRIAARTLAQTDPNRLHIEAQRFLNSKDVHYRVCGAEAVAWIENEKAFLVLYEFARHDQEAKVRKAADEAISERRRAILSCEYLKFILDTPADKLTTTWQYGQALQQLGDDETLRQLREASSQTDCLPNKCAYLEHLITQVEKGWKERQDKWKKRLEE